MSLLSAIPPSSSTVSVSIINSGVYIEVSSYIYFEPQVGFDKIKTPAYSFFIVHQPSGRKFLFDLSLRKDISSYSPVYADPELKDAVFKTEKSVDEIIEENGVKKEEIEGIFLSHHHLDHIGDPSKFPSSTSLIVGQGFKEAFIPGYPENPNSPILVTDYAGREVIELDFKSSSRIHGLPFVDFFSDGSLYLIDSPGHTIGHYTALARVTSSPPTFILLGGDYALHGGQIRPHELSVLPKEIDVDGVHIKAEELQKVHPNPEKFDRVPFFGAARRDRSKGEFVIHEDPIEIGRTVEKLQKLDSEKDDDVFVVLAHDATLLDVVEFFPKTADDWKEKGWGKKGRWRFVKDLLYGN